MQPQKKALGEPCALLCVSILFDLRVLRAY
jgi:hypothetical protein